MASMSPKVSPASFIAPSTTQQMFSQCRLEAISGTTPPYLRCSSTWVEMTEERIFRPFSTTAAAVSSQELSMPRILMLSFIS